MPTLFLRPAQSFKQQLTLLVKHFSNEASYVTREDVQ